MAVLLKAWISRGAWQGTLRRRSGFEKAMPRNHHKLCRLLVIALCAQMITITEHIENVVETI